MGPASPGDPGDPDGPWREIFFIKVKRQDSFSKRKRNAHKNCIRLVTAFYS